MFYSIARPEVRDLLVAAERLLIEGGQAVTLCSNLSMGKRKKTDRG